MTGHKNRVKFIKLNKLEEYFFTKSNGLKTIQGKYRTCSGVLLMEHGTEGPFLENICSSWLICVNGTSQRERGTFFERMQLTHLSRS